MLILLTEKYNEFDCLTQSDACANLSLNKELLEAAIGV